jgi:hypothetical protein
MAIKPLRNKKTGKVHWIADKYLQLFPGTWEPAVKAVEDGLVESETEKVVIESPKSGKKKEASDA